MVDFNGKCRYSKYTISMDPMRHGNLRVPLQCDLLSGIIDHRCPFLIGPHKELISIGGSRLPKKRDGTTVSSNIVHANMDLDGILPKKSMKNIVFHLIDYLNLQKGEK